MHLSPRIAFLVCLTLSAYACGDGDDGAQAYDSALQENAEMAEESAPSGADDSLEAQPDGESTQPDDASVDSNSGDDAPGDGDSQGEIETPTDETPTDETPTDETPTDETPTDETPTDETPTDETPTDETPEDEPEALELPVGPEDGTASSACELSDGPTTEVISASDIGEAGQVLVLPSASEAYLVTLPESGEGYITLQVPDWAVTIGAFLDSDTTLEVLDPDWVTELILPLSWNGACSDSGMTDQRLKYHSWGSFTVKLVGEPNAVIHLAFIKVE